MRNLILSVLLTLPAFSSYALDAEEKIKANTASIALGDIKSSQCMSPIDQTRLSLATEQINGIVKSVKRPRFDSGRIECETGIGAFAPDPHYDRCIEKSDNTAKEKCYRAGYTNCQVVVRNANWIAFNEKYYYISFVEAR